MKKLLMGGIVVSLALSGCSTESAKEISGEKEVNKVENIKVRHMSKKTLSSIERAIRLMNNESLFWISFIFIVPYIFIFNNMSGKRIYYSDRML